MHLTSIPKALIIVEPILYGPVAQLVERLICTEEVAGSNPVGSTDIQKFRFIRDFLYLKESLGEIFERRTEVHAEGVRGESS